MWVEEESFVGLDRRKRRGFRFPDRRRALRLRNAPSLDTLIRQVRVGAFNLHTPEALKLMQLRLAGAADLAQLRGKPQLAAALAAIATDLVAAPPLSAAEADGFEQRILDACRRMG